METLTECPVCNSEHISPFLSCKDYLVSGEEFTIQQCQSCHFRFTNPRPDTTTIGSYYKSDQYISHNDTGGGLINSAYRIVRSYTLRNKLNLINKLNGSIGRLLDVGCGTGMFLEACLQNGWQVTGMEPDSDARTTAAHRLKAAINPDLATIARSEPEPFDIITLWHVLEHIADLKTSIQQLRILLSERGTLIIAVPNSNSYDARYFKQHWAAYDVPRHLHHFTPETIEPLFAEYGLRLVGKKPMKFDAFYIALLSSRYSTGKTNYLKSIQVALASNAEAARTGQSSSVIYLFRKA